MLNRDPLKINKLLSLEELRVHWPNFYNLKILRLFHPKGTREFIVMISLTRCETNPSLESSPDVFKLNYGPSEKSKS